MATILSDGDYRIARHVDYLSDRLVDCAAGRIKRLGVAMPPRHSKSETISHWFPVWLLKLNPKIRVILASYEATFAASWGRRVRNTILENEDKLGIRLSKDMRGASNWETTAGGGMRCAGALGPITGTGADYMIIDDPIKNSADAQSPTQRANMIDWYKTTASSRLQPGGKVIVVQTRWHQEDLMGWLIENNKEENWHVVNMPAIAVGDDDIGRSRGEALWPSQYPLEELLKIKKRMGEYWWSAMYQGSPIVREGGFFDTSYIDVVTELPFTPSRVVRYWDFAGTEAKRGKDPDWTVGAKLVEGGGEFCLVDLKRDRMSAAGVERLVRDTAIEDGYGVPILIEQEGGSSGKGIISHFKRKVLKGYEVHGDHPSGSKEDRARLLSSAVETGLVKIMKAGWNNDLLDEFELFPNGKHDDIVDAVGGGHRYLSRGSRVREGSVMGEV